MTAADQGDGDLIDAEEAAALLEVPLPQLHAMVEEGLLVPADAASTELRFVRSQVLAARGIGG